MERSAERRDNWERRPRRNIETRSSGEMGNEKRVQRRNKEASDVNVGRNVEAKRSQRRTLRETTRQSLGLTVKEQGELVSVDSPGTGADVNDDSWALAMWTWVYFI